MDIYAFAYQMELDGELFYRKLAKGCADKSIVGALNLLADMEVRHAELVKALKAGLPRENETVGVSDKVHNMFQEIYERGEKIDLGETLVETYRAGMELELKSRDFYLDKIDELGSDEAKALFERLAAEELRHYQVLETIIDLVEKPIDVHWLENAEWSHSQDF